MFILLCGTIVLLSRSIRLDGLQTAPATVGDGGVSEIVADRIRLVGVADRDLHLGDAAYASVDALVADLRPDEVVVLVPVDALVSHHRVMAVWSAFTKRGLQPHLGVQQQPVGSPAAVAAKTAGVKRG